MVAATGVISIFHMNFCSHSSNVMSIDVFERTLIITLDSMVILSSNGNSATTVLQKKALL